LVFIEMGTITMPDAATKKKYTLSEIARLIGIEEKQIHLFAHKGLIHPITSKENEAQFTEVDCARLKVISHADKLGYSSDNIFNLIGTFKEMLDSEDPLSACEQFAVSKYKQIYDELSHCEPLEQLNKQCDLKLITGYIKDLKGIRHGAPQNLQKQDATSQRKSASAVKGVEASMGGAKRQEREPAPTPDVRRYSVAKYWEYMKKVEDLQKEVAADIPHDDTEPRDASDRTVDDDVTLLSVPEEANDTQGKPSLSHVREREEPHPRAKVFDKKQSWGVWTLTGVFLVLISAGYFILSSHNNNNSKIDRADVKSNSLQGDSSMAEPQKTAESVSQTSRDSISSNSTDEPSVTPSPSVNLEVQDLSLRHDQLHHIYQADFTIAKNDAADNRESVSGYAFVFLKFGDQTSGEQSLLLPSGEIKTGKPDQVRRGARFTIKNFKQLRVTGVSELPAGDLIASSVLVYSAEGKLLLEKAFTVSIQPFIASSDQPAAASEEPSVAAMQSERVELIDPEPPPAVVPDAPPADVKEAAAPSPGAAPRRAAPRPASSIKEKTIVASRPVSRPKVPTPPKVAGSDVKPAPQAVEKKRRPPTPVRSPAKIRSTGNPEAAKWEQKSYNAAVRGDFEQAIADATKAVELDPGRINPYINRSWAYLQKNMLDEAIKDCKTALLIDPENAFAYNNRGLVYLRQGKTSLAKKDYSKACDLGLELGCRNFDGLVSETRVVDLIKQSQAAFKAQKWDEVIRAATEVIKIDPQNAVAYANRSAAYAQKNYLNKALKDSNEAIAFNPDFALAYNNRGFVFELMGNNRKAAADYLKSCSLGSDLGCNNYERLNKNP
jgi:Flp pilus assembly protein TadD/DNA-binding transcriptional MerR regulator